MSITGIYIYADGSNLEQVADKIESSIRNWIQESGIHAQLVNEHYKPASDIDPDDYTNWDLGINLNFDHISELKKIIDYLYPLAVKKDIDFALGYYNEKTGVSEDISYFGAKSGKPKVDEIHELLGIPR